MKLNKIRLLIKYENFERLILLEFQNFKNENNLKSNTLEDVENESLKDFNKYFFLRLNSTVENDISEIKDGIISNAEINIDRIIIALEGIGKQIEIWKNKIGYEYDLKLKSNKDNWKLYAYEAYFSYCEIYENLILEIVHLIEKQTDRKVEITFTAKPIKQKLIQEDKVSKNESELMTRNEVSDYLKVTYRQVINIENNGYFTRTNTTGGRGVRYLRKDIENYAKGKG